MGSIFFLVIDIGIKESVVNLKSNIKVKVDKDGFMLVKY